MATRPTSTQLVMPLFDELQQRETLKPREAYGALADRLHLPRSIREEQSTDRFGQSFNIFERDVRWARQCLAATGLLDTSTDRGVWRLKERAGDLIEQSRGVVFTILRTPAGFLLWGRVEDALQHVQAGSVQLAITSPPYPSIQREYGTSAGEEWLDWMRRICEAVGTRMTADGSLVLNLGSTFRAGGFEDVLPMRLVLALEDIGLKLRQTLLWRKTNALAAPVEYVAKRKTLFRPSVERLYWFAAGSPKAYTDRLCTAYKRRPSATDRRTRADRRPSGHTAREDAAFFAGTGRLPDDIFECGVAHPSEPWRQRAKSLGIPPHPAVFPPAVADRLITALSDPGDVVLDPFMGSGTTAAAAEALGRRWIGIEKSRRYAKLAGLRLIDHGGEWLGPDHERFNADIRSCK